MLFTEEEKTALRLIEDPLEFAKNVAHIVSTKLEIFKRKPKEKVVRRLNKKIKDGHPASMIGNERVVIYVRRTVEHPEIKGKPKALYINVRARGWLYEFRPWGGENPVLGLVNKTKVFKFSTSVNIKPVMPAEHIEINFTVEKAR